MCGRTHSLYVHMYLPPNQCKKICVPLSHVQVQGWIDEQEQLLNQPPGAIQPAAVPPLAPGLPSPDFMQAFQANAFPPASLENGDEKAKARNKSRTPRPSITGGAPAPGDTHLTGKSVLVPSTALQALEELHGPGKWLHGKIKVRGCVCPV